MRRCVRPYVPGCGWQLPHKVDEIMGGMDGRLPGWVAMGALVGRCLDGWTGGWTVQSARPPTVRQRIG